MFQAKVVERIKTHLISSNFLFFRKVSFIMSKNILEPETPQAIWRMSVACLIDKATRAKEQ